MSSRIYGDKSIQIDHNSTLSFFEKRAKEHGHDLLNVTMYQDKHPEIAIKRNEYEKEKILPLLKLNTESRVLDAGCGVGRWCKPVIDAGAEYFGTDFSQSLVDVAKKTYSNQNRAYFQVLAAEQLDFDLINTDKKFSHAIISGVLMYLNDDDLICFLKGLSTCMKDNSVIYFREPIAIEQRLTLKEHWSDELDSQYNAVYRTREELLSVFTEILIKNGFDIKFDHDLYENEELNNRKETIQRFYILER